jgi:hypothetical protein
MASQVLVGLGLLGRRVYNLGRTLFGRAVGRTISRYNVLCVRRRKVLERVGWVRLDRMITLVPVGRADFAVLWEQFQK